MGKSNFTSWEAAEYILFYIGDKDMKDLKSDYNLFTFKGFVKDDSNIKTLNEIVASFNDNWIYQFDMSLQQHDAHSTSCDKKSDTINIDNVDNDTEVLCQDNVSVYKPMGITHIVWGIKKSDKWPKVINTCAIDTILVILNVFFNRNDVIRDFIQQKVPILSHVMILVNKMDHDEARILMINKFEFIKIVEIKDIAIRTEKK